MESAIDDEHGDSSEDEDLKGNVNIDRIYIWHHSCLLLLLLLYSLEEPQCIFLDQL